MKKFKVVGKPLPRLDGLDSVTGRAPFTRVRCGPAGMLHAKLFAAPFPHARIHRFDVSCARAVMASSPPFSPPTTRRGSVSASAFQDEQLLPRDKVRYVGDVIAAVAAVDEHSPNRRVDVIECDLDELPAALTSRRGA